MMNVVTCTFLAATKVSCSARPQPLYVLVGQQARADRVRGQQCRDVFVANSDVANSVKPATIHAMDQCAMPLTR